MYKLLLSCFMFLSVIPVKNNICKVEKIEYITDDYYEGNIYLNITLNSSIRDVIQLNVTFYDKDKTLLNNKSFSSVVTIQGLKNTVAKIPFDFDEKIYLNAVIYSGNLEEEIENIMFPIYPKEKSICDLSKEKICRSENPTFIQYKNNKITEKYSHVAVVNEDLEYVSFNNFLLLNKIHLLGNLTGKEKDITLIGNDNLVYKKILNNDLFFVPLNIFEINNIITFDLLDRYYVNLIEGKTSENYLNNSVYVNRILLPYIDQEYHFIINARDSFVGFENVVIPFTVITKGKLIGNCIKDKYCIRRSYL